MHESSLVCFLCPTVYSKFRLAVVASQMMRGQATKYFFLEPPLTKPRRNRSDNHSKLLQLLCDAVRLKKVDGPHFVVAYLIQNI